MSGNIRELTRPITRHARRKLVTWEQIASLADVRELLAAAEREAGAVELVRLKAERTR